VPGWRLWGRWRALIQITGDSAAWAIGLWCALWGRYDFNLHGVLLHGVPVLIALAALLQATFGLISGLYKRRWRFGSFDELAALVPTTAAVGLVLFGLNLGFRQELFLPRSVPVIGAVIALMVMAAGRYLWRLLDERRRRPNVDGCKRVLVFGAGDAGVRIIQAMLRNPDSPYVPVAILDDDPAKQKLRIMGVPVVGTRADLLMAATQRQADVLLIAIPSATSALVTELSELAAAASLPVKVLPPVAELIGGAVGLGDIRDVTPADLLGRHEIVTDLDAIAGYLTGRRVLVTGAGGSIGSELCRQIYRFAPDRLIMLDRDESALHNVQLSIEGRAMLDSPDLVLLDLRDRAAVEQLLAERRPHVIFHAAALKHLPLLELYPAEAVKTNVWGTIDLLEAAATSGVERFVNISTDKAADPSSVLGYSKRITERLTAHVALHSAMTCLSVRFGNVLGSRGSVLTTFQAQIDRGGPITVTHPDVTRYFMTVEEAVQLVIQAGAIGADGEVLVLDMGEPVRIQDVARLLAARSERPIAIHYTKLRVGEKLHETVFAADEDDRRPVHPLISHVPVPALPADAVRSFELRAGHQELVAQLRLVCGLAVSVPASSDD
jgi:FlaA1/EpsC-like NDP-sugar epimerase